MTHFFQITPLVQNIGLAGIFFMVFAETGLFFGFFLPGDTLLFTAGLLASAGYFNIIFLLFGAFFFAVLGDSVGYYFGKSIGPKIFSRPDSFFFNKRNLERTSRFFEKHGKKTITLARFVPIVRTFAPTLAGVALMQYKDFLFFNILGGFLWTGLATLLGYFLGSFVKNIDQYLLPIIALIIFVSFIPIAVEFYKEKRYNR